MKICKKKKCMLSDILLKYTLKKYDNPFNRIICMLHSLSKKNLNIADQVSLFYCMFDIFNISYKKQVGVP